MKILLSSWENPERVRMVLEEKYPYLLSSFLYIKNIQPWLKSIFKLKKIFLLDSGAHTFQKEGNETDYDKFVFEYAKFVKNTPEIDEYVELDIENKVGLKQVEKWREYLTKIIGKPPIVVWHRERGKKYWEYMVKKYPYVGFSGFVVTPNGEKEVPEKYIGWFIKKAHENGAKIHGFGLTSQRILRKFPFDTVDSSSWIKLVGYGGFPIFKNGKIEVKKLGKKQGVKVKLSRYQISMREWKKLCIYMEKYWEAKLNKKE